MIHLLLGLSLLATQCVKSSKSTLPSFQQSTPVLASEDMRYRELITQLQLSDAPEQPSKLLESSEFRDSLGARLRQDAERVTCSKIEVLQGPFPGLEPNTNAYLLGYQIAPTGSAMHLAYLHVPSAAQKMPLGIYGNSRIGQVLDPAEIRRIFGGTLQRMVVVAPLLGTETLVLNGQRLQSASATEQSFYSDVDRFQGIGVCLQSQASALAVGDKKLSEWLMTGPDGVLRTQTWVGGTGTGALVAQLALARSGAQTFANAISHPTWLRADCGILVNPFHSIYAAEARLLLYNLARGLIDETRYAQIPGIKLFAQEWFQKWRTGEITTEQLAFEILLRDGMLTAPFLNFALRQYQREPNDKGFRAGALLMLHEIGRTDYSVYQSRVYANVASTVQFISAEATNGIHLLYRELNAFPYSVAASYGAPFSAPFENLTTQLIEDRYIAVTDRVKGKEKEYKWTIRGRAFADVDDVPSRVVTEQFLKQGCLLPN